MQMQDQTAAESAGGESEGALAQAQQQVQEKAQQVRSEAGGRIREQVDQRSTQAGEQATAVSDALRTSGNQLREQGNESSAKLLDQAAQRIDGLGGYLKESDADKILGDVEGWMRTRPWAAAGIGVLAGFVASRFLKASSARRYAAYSNGHRQGLTTPPSLPRPESTYYDQPGAM